MVTKEEILKSKDGIDGFSTNGNYVDGCARCVYEAMDEWAMIESIEFGKFLSGHKLDFQPASNNNWIGLNMETYTNEELYKLFQQSKQQ